MPSFYIRDLAEVLIIHYGDDTTTIKEVGIREGEKIDEVLISEHESALSYNYNKDYYVILPTIKINKDYSHLEGSQKVTFKTFSSADNLHSNEFLYNLLSKGGFLI